MVVDELAAALVKTGGRLVKYARYYWLLLAESHLTQRLFGSMVWRIEALPVPAGGEGELYWAQEGGDGEVSEKLLRNEAMSGFPVPGRDRAGPFLACRSRSGWKDKQRLQRRRPGVYWPVPGKIKRKSWLIVFCQDSKGGLSLL